MKKPNSPACLDFDKWRAISKLEVVDWLRRDNIKKANASQIIVRSRLRPIDVYCYLKARFGEPNGFQNSLRKDSSDNWIHWDYNIRIEEVNIYFAGTSREILVMVDEHLSDNDWRNFIVGIKADYTKYRKEKSAILKTLEKYVVFQNKFVSLAELCADLHAEIVDTPAKVAFPNEMPSDGTKLKSIEEVMRKQGTETTKLFGNCLKLRILMPIMAEAFINMIILMFTRDAIRNNADTYQAFIRAKIPDRLSLLNKNCDGFIREVNKSTISYAAFMTVMNKRNFALHGNIDPLREQIETVYFDGKRPLFRSPGNHLQKFFDGLESLYKPTQIVAEYEAVHTFFLEIVDCLNSNSRKFFEQVISDAYPGFEVYKQRVTRILPDQIIMGMLPGMRYDNDLEVHW
jgi:hypothetical protein